MATQNTTSLQFEAGKTGQGSYDVKSLVYPMDLLENGDSNRYSNNRVVFFINVNEAGKTSKGTAARPYKNYDIPDSQKAAKSGQKITELGGNVPFVEASKKRLSAAIVLYMPNNLVQDTSVTWNEEDLDSNMAAVIRAGAQVAGGDLEGAVSTGVSQLGSNVLGQTPNIQALIRTTPGNTRAEQLFKKVNFRSFTMNYSFVPKSETEAANVLSIIRMFKHHMLPEYKDGFASSFMFLYPSEFQIKYYVGSSENQHVEKQLTAVLNSVSINYSPNGIFSTFPNGMPQQIDFTMSFTELSIPTKETSPFDGLGV